MQQSPSKACSDLKHSIAHNNGKSPSLLQVFVFSRCYKMLSLVLAADGEGPTLMSKYHLCPHRHEARIFVAELSKSETLQAGWGSV